MEIIKALDASYRYLDDVPEGQAEPQSAPAVDKVSFSVEEGSFVAVLGHNGSGKSTLAKLLNALYLPTEGNIVVCGIDTSEGERVFDIRSQAGMVFQNPDNQLVSTVVEEDVAFGPENMGVEPKEIRARVDEALRVVRMSEHAQSAPHMLSGGQKQRIAIAGVLAMQPRVMIFDESTAMLDPSGREEVLSTVRRINRERGITVMWITHFMEEAAQADRVIVMNDGGIVMDGTPRNVFRHVEELKALGLDVPEMTELALQLSRAGMAVREDVLTVDEMVEEICRLKSNT
ncbi:MAG: energy-coupling factor transporter ATPase [Candidatus Fimadaptatus sp.]